MKINSMDLLNYNSLHSRCKYYRPQLSVFLPIVTYLSIAQMGTFICSQFLPPNTYFHESLNKYLFLFSFFYWFVHLGVDAQAKLDFMNIYFLQPYFLSHKVIIFFPNLKLEHML